MKRCIYSGCFRIGKNEVQSKYLDGESVVLKICNKHYKEYLEIIDEGNKWDALLEKIRDLDDKLS